VVEISERAVLHRPADLLHTVDRIRDAGWGLAIDDVGINPESLALLPILDPDVVKLDLSVIQDRPSRHTGSVLRAVLAQAERSGAAIVAEGIETPEHREIALGLGASLGQGWLFGRPGPLPFESGVEPTGPLAIRPVPSIARAAAPYDLVHERIPMRTARKDLLLAISRDLEDQANRLNAAPVVLAAFQHVRHLTPGTVARYRELARRCAFVATFAVGLDPEPIPGVRGAALPPGDALCDEWTVVVLSGHFAGALVARDLGDTGPDGQRRFRYGITHDRHLVTETAAALLGKIPPTA
jgi:hypothetical protein